jgi:hypothetical protein
MPFSLFQDKVTTSSLKVNGTSYTLDKDFWISAAAAPQKLFTSAEVFYVGAEFNDKSTLDVRGKLLISSEGKERAMSKTMAAQKLGAIGIINIAKTNPTMPSNLNGRMAFAANTNTFLSMTVSKTVGAAYWAEQKNSVIKNGKQSQLVNTMQPLNGQQTKQVLLSQVRT